MNKKIILSALAFASVLTACDDDYMKQFEDQDANITDVKNLTMTLENSDYSSIASNATNIAKALELDPENQTYVEMLKQVGTQYYFTDDIAGEDYIPAYLMAKYPNADQKSKFTVTYKKFKKTSSYLADFANISSYQLSGSDYEGVWGDKVKASFLTPQTLNLIPGILKENMSGAAEGTMCVVNYAYSDVEPSIGGGQPEEEQLAWTKIASIPARTAGKDWNYVNVGPIDLSDYKGKTVKIAFEYTSTDTTNPKWEIENFRAGEVPYVNLILFAKQTDGSFKKVVTKKGFAGAGEYVLASLWTDGKYYPFGRIAGDKNYGYCTPEAITVTDGVISATDAADFVVTLEEGTKGGFYIKNAIGKYLYAGYNASKNYYYNSFNAADKTGEQGYEWTVTNINNNNDLFVIKNVDAEQYIRFTTFNGTLEFGNWAESKVENNLLASTLIGDEAGFIATEDGIWKNDATYGWVSQASKGVVSASKLETPEITFSETAAMPFITFDEAMKFGTADMLNVYVAEVGAAAAAKKLTFRAAANVAPNAAALYRYDGTAWKEYSNSDAHVAVLSQKDYDEMGAATVGDPANALPIYLAKKFPYLVDESMAVVVYAKSNDAMAAKEFSVSNGVWAPATNYTMETAVFVKDGDEISANISTHFDNSLINDEGGLKAQDTELTGDLTYIWKNNNYGWVASAYKNGTTLKSESWLVTPAFNFLKAKHPVMTFDHACNKMAGYSSDEELMQLMKERMKVFVSVNYTGDVKTCDWTELEIPGWPTGTDWNFAPSGIIDLSSVIGNKKVVIAFMYKSTEISAQSWEVQNLKVYEQTEE